MARPRYGVGLDTSDNTTVALCRIDQCPWRALTFTRAGAFAEWQYHAEEDHPAHEALYDRMPVNLNYGAGKSKKVPACG